MQRTRGDKDWVLIDPAEEFFVDVWREDGDQVWGAIALPGVNPLATRARVKTYSMQMTFAGAAPGTIYYLGPPPDRELWIVRGMSWWLAHAANPMLSFDVSLITWGYGIGGIAVTRPVDTPLLVPDYAIALAPYLGSFNAGTPFTMTAGQSFAFNAVGGGVRMIHRARETATGRKTDAIRIHGHGDGINPAMLQISLEMDRYRYEPPNPNPGDI